MCQQRGLCIKLHFWYSPALVFFGPTNNAQKHTTYLVTLNKLARYWLVEDVLKLCWGMGH